MSVGIFSENTMSHLIPHKWEADESQGDMAVYAPVLYCNKNHPDLKEKVPRKSELSGT